jgi:CTP:molybdopterin cytidylyltransferase MocA
MALIEEVHSALKPLIDSGAVLDVRRNPDDGFIVYVGDQDPMVHKAEVDRLIHEAGLAGKAIISVQAGYGPTI